MLMVKHQPMLTSRLLAKKTLAYKNVFSNCSSLFIYKDTQLPLEAIEFLNLVNVVKSRPTGSS